MSFYWNVLAGLHKQCLIDELTRLELPAFFRVNKKQQQHNQYSLIPEQITLTSPYDESFWIESIRAITESTPDWLTELNVFILSVYIKMKLVLYHYWTC